MAKKDRSFAAKMQKATAAEKTPRCPTCGTPIQPVFLVRPVQSEMGHYRFKHNHTKLCKCNRPALGL